MSAQDNATKLGKPNQNLVLETAGRIYVKVQDRFYELDFRNQNNKSVVNVTNNITEAADSPDLSGFVTKKYLKASLAEYVTKRTWAGIKETTSMLENALLEGFTESISPITINTMQLVVGSEQLQYDFITSLSNSTVVSNRISLSGNYLELNDAYIKHYTLNGPNAVRKEDNSNINEIESLFCRWHIKGSSFDLDEGAYYLYLKVPNLGVISGYEDGYPLLKNRSNNTYKLNSSDATDRTPEEALYWKTNNKGMDNPSADTNSVIYQSLSEIDGVYFVSQEAVELETVEEIDGNNVSFYNLLFAIINGAGDDGEREFTTMNGFTEITPGRITAYRFVSPDGEQYLNFLDKTFHLGDGADIPMEGQPDPNYTSYIHWDPINGLMIKGKVEVTGGNLQDVLDTIQNQLDGSVKSWFSGDAANDNASLIPAVDLHCVPTLSTWPAHLWVYEDPDNPGTYINEYEDHLGDVYYITDDTQAYINDQNDPKIADTYKGNCYRFIKTTDANNQPTYEWVLLNDAALSEALRLAYENRDKISGYEYLKEALENGKTIADGGLILTSIIQLGNWSNDGTVDRVNIHAGINGLLEDWDSVNNQYTYHDIAAWYGGPMEDKFEFQWDDSNHTSGKWILKNTQPLASATSLFRHDGTGYLANGNIYWQADGSLRVPGITLDQNEDTGDWEIRLDSGVIIDGTNTTIGEYDAFFELVDGNLHVKNDRGIYTNGFGSFGGLNPNTSVNVIDSIWQSLTGNTDSYAGWKVNVGHLPLQSIAGSGLDVVNNQLVVTGGGSGTGSGSVTSVTLTQGTGIAVSDSGVAITNIGTRTISLSQEYITKISNLESRNIINWDDYFGIDENDNIFVKPIEDETNNTTTPRGFYNTGFGSFGGLNSNSNTGISLETVWNSLTSSSDSYASRQINAIHLPDLPIATSNTLGAIKVGSGLSISNGVLSVTGGGSGSGGSSASIQFDDNVVYSTSSTYSPNNGIIKLPPYPSSYTLPNLFIAQTAVSQTSAVAPLLGISGITNTDTANTSGDLSYIYWDSRNNAWHLNGNLIADGYGSFGGINSQSGSTTSLLDVWKSLTNNNNLNDYSSTTKIHLDHISINEILSQYVLPTATTDNLGGVKLGDSTQRTIDTNNKTYGVGVTETGQLAVYVPWSGGGSGGNVDIIVPTTTPTLTNGDTILATINSVNIKAKIGTYVPMTVNNGNYFVSDNLYTYSLIPRSDNTYYLGYNENNTTRRWKEIWGVNIYGNTVRGSLYDLVGNNYVAISTAYQTKITSSNKLDYSLLSNTPTIPAAQVQSDWNATTGVAAILNKPTIPAAQIQSDWTQNSTSALDYIKNKPTIPTITLNGSGTTSPSFYAPTDSGTNGQFLIWNGAPSWQTKNFLSSVSLSDLPKGNTGTVLIGKGNSTDPEFSSTPTITSLTINGISITKQTSTPVGLKIDANVVSSGKFYDSSDIRLKTKIEDILCVLDKLDYIPIVRYEYLTQKDRKYIGTLAQPLLSLYPELVNKDDNGYYSVDYGGLAAVAIAGLKELSQKVKSLEAKLYGYEY